MNSPFNKRFKVTGAYKESEHKGLDLVGLDSKEIHSTVDGVVEIARWENANNTRQGFGQYVMVREYGTDRCFIYAHLSKILVKAGDIVHVGTVVGIEGNTGYSFGSHCHYEVREGGINGRSLNVSEISGIPNNEGGIYDDGYRETNEIKNKTLDEYVRDVWNNVYGVGEVRKQKLGNIYQEVQNRVNDYIKMANEVIEGRHGNYPERKTNVEALGYNYELVQRIVNETLGIW